VPGLERLRVSVNRSARELLMPGATAAVAGILAESGLAPHDLCLEITESVLLEDADASARALAALKVLGIGIAVDDFGTGYSSLTYLKQFPVDTLKIDRSFVAGLGSADGQADRAIVAGIIDLAHAFGLVTVAEGIETAEQLAALQQLGCAEAQGYLLSAPMRTEDATGWLERAQVRSVATADRQGRPDGGPRRVLVVEDDRGLRTLTCHVLDDLDGYEVAAAASDGREAIALARHHQPDLLLLDLAMPGIGGLEALPLLRAVAPRADIVIVSGVEPGDVEREALARGAIGFIQKGLEPDRLMVEVERILARHTAVDALA
jgi:CheY-like chemotaxis protein